MTFQRTNKPNSSGLEPEDPAPTKPARRNARPVPEASPNEVELGSDAEVKPHFQAAEAEPPPEPGGVGGDQRAPERQTKNHVIWVSPDHRPIRLARSGS